MHSDNIWTPLFETSLFRKGKEGIVTYWPMGCTDNEFLAVICKGIPYPSHPKPLISDLPLSLSFLELDAERTKMEEKSARNRLLLFQSRSSKTNSNIIDLTRRETELDKVALQLIVLACKQEQTQRVLDICAQAFSVKTLDGAIKIASYNKMLVLAERVSQMKEV